MPPEFILDLTQLGAHPVAARLSPKQEAAAPVAPADVREAEEVECLRVAKVSPASGALAIVRAFLFQRGL